LIRPAPGSVSLEDEDIQPLGGPVNGSREASRPGADHDEFAHDRLVHPIQAQAFPDLLDRRPLEDARAATDEDRDVVHAHPEAF
jgi:hypothetical protein